MTDRPQPPRPAPGETPAPPSSHPLPWHDPAALTLAVQCFQALLGPLPSAADPPQYDYRVVYRLTYYTPHDVCLVMQCEDVELEVQLGGRKVLLLVAGRDILLDAPDQVLHTLQHIRRLLSDPWVERFVAAYQATDQSGSPPVPQAAVGQGTQE